LRNWKVSRRLIALVLIPTVFASVLGALRIITSANSTDAYTKVERLGRLDSAVTDLTQDLGTERDQTISLIANGRPSNTRAQMQDQYSKVDTDVSQVRSLASGIDNSYGAAQAYEVRVVLNRLDGITALRSAAADSQMPASTVIEKYSDSIGELLSLLDGSTSGVADDTLARDARALGAVSRAKEQASRLRSYLSSGLLTGFMSLADRSSAIGAQAGELSEESSFRTSASVDQQRTFDDTVIGSEVDQAGLIQQQILSAVSSGDGSLTMASPQNATAWFQSQSGKIDRLRSVQQDLAKQILGRSRDQKDSAQADAYVGAAIAAILLLLVLGITVVMARSLVLPLRKLRRGALEVADSGLPGLVARLRDPQAAVGGIEVAPIDIDTTDEIGEVARAFDEVHREAVRLAANEAVLRGNVNAMFVNLSRRSQSLIERQLRLIDELEQGEQDDDRLASLFRLDHLATRMRRNCENLLVLGGQDQVRRWNQPVPLLDVVRASLSEVEQYERVEVRVQSEVSIVGSAVNDLVHLVAELVENAIIFSPEHTAITVSGHLVSGGGAMLQITDQGVGMTPEELAEANNRLATQPVVDVSVARRMGLFVVGRLAARHGIRVELRSTVSGGVTAFALLPSRLIALAELAMDGRGGYPPQVETGYDDGFATGVQPVGRPSVPGSLTRPVWRTGETGPQVPVNNTMPGRRPGPGPGPGMMPPRQPPALPPGAPLDPYPVANDPYASGPYGNVPTQGDPFADRVNGRDPYAAPMSAPPPSAPPASMPPPVGPPPNVPPQRPPAEPPYRGAPPQQQPAWDSTPNGPWGAAEERTGRRSERSPIFEAMTSEWFQRRPVDEKEPFQDAWRSPADAGWEAAAATTANPVDGGRTTAGLPKRVPGKNRVPGRVPSGNQQNPAPPPPRSPQQQAPPQGMPQRGRPPAGAAPQPPSQIPPGQPVAGESRRLSPDAARARFGGLQRGVQRGRTEAKSGPWPGLANGDPKQGNAPGRGEDDFETGETT
jgi:signal transduction histidine kinase